MITSNKSVVIYTILGPNYITDHWGIFRGKGRMCINIGFGLAELGYDVNLINSEFKDLSFEFNNKLDNINGRVTLSKSPIRDYYDFNFYFGGLDTNIKCGKEIAIVNYSHEIQRIHKLAVEFVTPYTGILDYTIRESKRPVKYLPQLNPIPIYNKGFKEFNFNPKDNIVKVFVYISSWEKITYCMREFILILDRLKTILNDKGHKLKLYFQVHDEESKRDCKDLLRFGDEIEFIGKINYYDYLKFIESMDICILKGNQFMASAGMYDIIALGKPMLYVSEPYKNGNLFRNPLFQTPDEILFSDDNERKIKRKVDSFALNPETKHSIYRKNIEDCDFNNWKKYALKIFTL